MDVMLHYLSLSEVCRQIKSGARSAVSVTEAMVQRIDALDPTLHAYALRLTERALERADQLDRARADGRPLGALHGVPVAIKDLLFLAGCPTASGTLVMRGHDPGYTATVVEKLEAAGAVIIGKTQLTEGAFGSHHPEIEPPRNPWDQARWPGVSSSGSGVAVAAGMAYGALGSDTGGSIRFPSAACGLVGIKPTYGRVSRYGAFPLAESLDHIGPMTRTVEDAARMLGVIAGPDPRDPTALDAAVPNYVAAMSERVEGLRIGVDWDYVQTGVDAVVAQGVRDALRVLEGLGARIVEVTMPADYRALVEQWAVTTGRECALAHARYYPEQSDRYGPALSGLLDLGRSVTPQMYEAIERVRARFDADFSALLQGVDMLISPCMTSLPPSVVQMEATVAEDEARAAFITFTAPFDYSGHPTLTLPAGLDQGLPLSFQLIGRKLEESTLVRAGSSYERALGFDARPPVG